MYQLIVLSTCFSQIFLYKQTRYEIPLFPDFLLPASLWATREYTVCNALAFYEHEMSLIAHFAIPSNLIFYDKVDLAYSHMLHMGGWIVLDCQAYISAFMSSNETTQLVQSFYYSTTSSFSILSRVLKLRSLKPILIFRIMWEHILPTQAGLLHMSC